MFTHVLAICHFYFHIMMTQIQKLSAYLKILFKTVKLQCDTMKNQRRPFLQYIITAQLR